MPSYGRDQDEEISRFTESFLRQQIAAGIPQDSIVDLLMFRPGGSRSPTLYDLLDYAEGREWMESHADLIRNEFLEACREAPSPPGPERPATGSGRQDLERMDPAGQGSSGKGRIAAMAPSSPSPAARSASGPMLAPPVHGFDKVVSLIRDRRDARLLFEVEQDLKLVHYSPGRIEFEPSPGSAPDLASRLAYRLRAWTGMRWMVSVAASGGSPTLAEARASAEAEARTVSAANPLVQAIFTAFPEAEITAARMRKFPEDAFRDEDRIADDREEQPQAPSGLPNCWEGP